jgi:Lrp/AsnC family leucine-responsive transcriptional regulator
MNGGRLDAIDWGILHALQEDARLSFKQLARRVGLSPPATTERVRRLEDAGIITGYHAAVDAARVGWPIRVVMRLMTTEEGYARFVRAVGGMPEVMACHRVTGDDAFILEARVTSTAHLERLIDGLRPYGQSVTAVVLSSLVEARALPTPENVEEPLPVRAERGRNAARPRPPSGAVSAGG